MLIQTNGFYEEGDSHLDDKDSTTYSADIMAKYKISDTSDISLKYEKSREEGHDPGLFLTKDEYDADRYQVGADADDYQSSRTDRDVITSVYNNQFTENWKFNIQGTYQRKKDDRYSDDGDNTVSYLKNRVNEEQIDIKPEFQYTYVNDSVLTFGYDYNYQSSTRRINGIGSRTQRKTDRRDSESHSVYALNTFRFDEENIFNKFELTQGIRYNHTENTYSTTNKLDATASTPETDDDMDNMAYELALNYLYSDTGNAFVRWERGFNTPSASSIFNNPSASQIADGFTYGLSGVDEETYFSYEAGIRDYFLGSYVTLTVFYTKTDDEIFKDGNSKNWIAYNTDETERKGVEVSFEQYLGDLTLTESYSYIDAKITEGEYDGNGVPDVSDHSLYISAKYDFTEKLNAILSTTYKSSVYIGTENTGGRTNHRFLTDLIVNYNLTSDLRLYAGVNNIFDDEYAERIEDDTYRAADERNYFAGVSYTF